MNPAGLPIARELFAQWQRARGGRTDPASRPFSRSWEDLLEDARLFLRPSGAKLSGTREGLEAEGWVELKAVRYKPHLIDRLVIPLEAEARWREAFGFVPPSDEETRQIREFSWEPELSFLREARLNLSFAELRQVNTFLKDRSRERAMVPIKERSLQIFGDEKRLDMIFRIRSFPAWPPRPYKQLVLRVDRRALGLEAGSVRGLTAAHHCYRKRGDWHSYCRWNEERNLFSAVVYGDGNRFVDGIRYLKDLFAELGGPRRVFYFGDLDPQGLVIPQEASGRAQAAGLPAVEPHLGAIAVAAAG